jgi:hypothetical protein
MEAEIPIKIEAKPVSGESIDDGTKKRKKKKEEGSALDEIAKELEIKKEELVLDEITKELALDEAAAGDMEASGAMEASGSTDPVAQEWARLVAAVRRPGTGFPVADHRDGLLRTRPETFFGSEALGWLLKNWPSATGNDEARELLHRLLEEGVVVPAKEASDGKHTFVRDSSHILLFQITCKPDVSA